jgi:hypothetical protein
MYSSKKMNDLVLTKIIKLLFALAVLSLLYSCQGSIASQVIANSYPTAPRNYKTAGFDNSDDINTYTKHYQYLALKISDEDWSAFYKKFPEYWKDIQAAKSYTFMNDFNSGYTAYAFRWNMINKKKKWDEATIERLQSKKVLRGDDIYQIVFSLGIPDRIIWDNDFDILIYKDNTAITLEDSRYKCVNECQECSKRMSTIDKQDKKIDQIEDVLTFSDDEVLKILKLTRPDS